GLIFGTGVSRWPGLGLTVLAWQRPFVGVPKLLFGVTISGHCRVQLIAECPDTLLGLANMFISAHAPPPWPQRKTIALCRALARPPARPQVDRGNGGA